jgi:hypothetical protein
MWVRKTMSLGSSNAANMVTICVNLPITRHMDLLDRLAVVHLINKNFCCYETLRLIIIFTRSRHWITCWARWIQSIYSQIASLRSALILFFHQYSCTAVVSSLHVFLRLIPHKGVLIAKPLVARLLKKANAFYAARPSYRVSCIWSQ